MKAVFSICIAILSAVAVFSPKVVAQDAGVKTINGGIINGKAVSLPKPEYPDALRQAAVSGVVGVNVIIDESGNVVSAEAEINDQRMRKAEDGSPLEPTPVDPLLREAAENAARQAKFSPTFLNDVPVRVKGKIVYNFVVGDTGLTSGLKTVSGGVLNSKASSLPQPEYPAAAKAVRAGGTVSVQIAIDEEGNVVSAKVVSGHPLLRAASETAAREAKFLPTLLSGQPVKVAGILTYNFVLPKVEN